MTLPARFWMPENPKGKPYVTTGPLAAPPHVECVRVDSLDGWRDIKSAPEGEPHIRGMWVFDAHTKRPKYFEANVGYIDDSGDFVNMDGYDDFGWSADDYDWWCPLSLPLPAPPT